mgnify:CR=1 FL=1
MKKMMLALSLPLVAMAFGSNLLVNGDFADGFRAWDGNSYAGGKGSVGAASTGAFEDEQRFAKLVKSEGPGGAQMMQQARLPKAAAVLKFSFRAKGCPSNVYVKFLEADGKTPFLDSLGKPAQVKVVFGGATEWRDVKETLKVPPAAQGKDGWVRVHFGILAGQVEQVLLVDDVSLVAESAEAPAEIRPLDFRFAPTPAPDASYRTVEAVEDFSFELKDGLILRSGEPHFWVGNGVDLGAGHATPVGLWLARLQGQEFAAITDGVDWNAKLDGNTLSFSVGRIPAANVAWIREAERLGFIAQPTVTSRYFKWSNLKKYTKDHPDFADIHYDAGHYLSLDTGHPVGRRLLAEKRKGLLTQLKDDRRLVLELARQGVVRHLGEGEVRRARDGERRVEDEVCGLVAGRAAPSAGGHPLFRRTGPEDRAARVGAQEPAGDVLRLAHVRPGGHGEEPCGRGRGREGVRPRRAGRTRRARTSQRLGRLPVLPAGGG